ncbi:TPA: IS6 family transposase [Escherichia coli]
MNPFKGRHFQRDIILWAVRWYCKYGISYRELQEMLAERGVNVDHSTIYRWVQRYAPEMEKRLRWYWRNPSDLCPWHMDETYVKVNGRWAYLYRAVDSRGRTVDFYLSSRRNGTVAKLAMRQPFVLFKGLTFQKLCLPGAFRPGDHHNKMLRPGLCVVHASPQYL